MNELEKMELAKSYLDKMANGINPLTDEQAEEADMINNIKISRCLFYVSDIIRQVIENGGTVQYKTARNRKRFYITDEQKSILTVKEPNCYVKDIAEEINRVTQQNDTRRIQPVWITSWLVSIGMLEIVDNKKQATEQGNEIGIISEHRYSAKIGVYLANVYAPSAQTFIFDNIDAIVGAHYAEQSNSTQNI